MRLSSRTLLLAAGLGLVAMAAPGTAAPAPQIVDAQGDALDGSGAHDVHSVLFSKTAKGFTVALTLGGPSSTRQGVNYDISAETEECGTFTINWSPNIALPPGSRDQVTMQCGPDDGTGPFTIINVAPKAKGSTLTWTFNKKQFPPELRSGGTLSDLRAGVDQNEPVFGILGPTVLVPVRLDDAVGKGSFTF